MYLNKTYILGNLTRDPELKAMPNGTKVCNFSLATNRIYKDPSGNKVEQVEYHNIVTFARQAEICGEYLKKGQQCLVEGRLTTRSWEDANGGGKKYRTEIIADNVQFGAKNTQGTSVPSNNMEAEGGDTSNATTVQPASKNNLDTIDYGEIINPDDIPF